MAYLPNEDRLSKALDVIDFDLSMTINFYELSPDL